jgi:hypothetical protein
MHSKLPIKQKELSLLEITPSKALIDKEGWKMSMLKGLYTTRLPASI